MHISDTDQMHIFDTVDMQALEWILAAYKRVDF